MREYRITFNGRTVTHHADTVSAALAKLEMWENLGDVSELKIVVISRPDFGPDREGSPMCESGSIASGGTKEYCTCDRCF